MARKEAGDDVTLHDLNAILCAVAMPYPKLFELFPLELGVDTLRRRVVSASVNAKDRRLIPFIG